MERSTVVQHLNDNASEAKDEFTTAENEIFFNCINGQSSIVPREPNLAGLTVVKICIDLGIDVPFELEDLYHVFVNMNATVKNQRKQPPQS